MHTELSGLAEIKRLQTITEFYSGWRINLMLAKIPVMAAIAVRKKVISIGHFSSCFRLQSLQIFFLLEEIKSDYMH